MSSVTARRTDPWYEYIPVLGVSTSNISQYQLQCALINGVNLYLLQAF